MARCHDIVLGDVYLSNRHAEAEELLSVVLPTFGTVVRYEHQLLSYRRRAIGFISFGKQARDAYLYF